MKQLASGSVIGIPCEVQPGPFSGELLISVETSDGLISGFVREAELKEQAGGQWFVRAVVQEILNDIIEVRIQGSFFTTNGLATIPRAMAYAA